jgi:5-methylcytosine-specific restriction endonuclease McrA
MRKHDRRGNSRDRLARKHWMLSHFGDGSTANCYHCGMPLTLETMEADRIIPGGSYRRDNILPACRRCNASRGNKPLEVMM